MGPLARAWLNLQRVGIVVAGCVAGGVSQAEMFLGARGGVEVWSIPQPSPGSCFVAIKIELRTTDPDAKLVTFEDLDFSGRLVQLWLPTIDAPPLSTPKAPWRAGYPSEWAPYDSRLLIEPSMVGGGAGGGYAGIDESNDRSLTPIQGLPPAFGEAAPAGTGGISMERSTDAFFLTPPFQANTIELAYLVARIEDARGGLTMSLGVLGAGITNSGQSRGAQWGGSENPQPLPISFFPEEPDRSDILLEVRGGVEVWSLPQPAPGPGFVATRIELRTTDPGAKLVTFEGLAFSGKLVQLWLPTRLGTILSTPKAPWPLAYPPELAPYDSHLLIEPSMVGGGAGGSYGGIDETNDFSLTPIQGLPQASGKDVPAGVGGISMAHSTDAFFLNPSFQANRVGLAYLVARTTDAENGGFAMSLGVLGVGISNSGEPGGAQWGGTENENALFISFSPEPPDPSHVLLGQRGQVEVWSLPQPPPGPGYVATRIELRTSDASARIVTFEGLAFSGELLQVWLPRRFGGLPLPTPKSPWPLAYPIEWAFHDSRILIEASMVGGQAGGGYTAIGEDNNRSIGTIKGLPQYFGLDPVIGVGGIAMGSSRDAFFVDPPFQDNRIELAYLVARTADAEAGGFAMSLGVLGSGIRNSGMSGGAQWGGTENPVPLAIAFAASSGGDSLRLNIRRVGGGIDVTFTTEPGRIHALQYSKDLVSWQTLATDLCGKVHFEDRNATRMARKTGFYRVVEQ